MKGEVEKEGWLLEDVIPTSTRESDVYMGKRAFGYTFQVSTELS